MFEKYKPYGYDKPRIIIHLTALPPVLLLLAKTVLSPVTEKNHDTFAISAEITLLVLVMTFVLYLPFLLKCSFTADEYSVTFKPPFSKDVTINYLDIVDIRVNAEKTRIWSPGSRYRSTRLVYLETIEIMTVNGKITFRTVMDMTPNPRLEAMMSPDKIFEMGKFNILKKYIEIKSKNIYV